MAHPKRKISKSRRDKRRTHDKAVPSPVFIDKPSGTIHLPHRTFVLDGNTYYRGRLIIESQKQS